MTDLNGIKRRFRRLLRSGKWTRAELERLSDKCFAASEAGRDSISITGLSSEAGQHSGVLTLSVKDVGTACEEILDELDLGGGRMSRVDFSQQVVAG
jgi:hypothetical protein